MERPERSAISTSALLTPERLEEETLKLLAKNKNTMPGFAGLFRGDGGLYDPINLYPHYIIQTWDIPNPASQPEQ